VLIAGRRERVVLAALAVWAGEAVSTHRLIDAVWGEQPPRSCEKALQNAVLRLRKVLTGNAIHTAPGGYALGTDPAAVDLWRFERLVGQGRQLARNEQWVGAEAALSDALALWRGEPLAELGDWAPAVAERTRLTELHRTITEELMEAGLAGGRHHQLVADLEAMADREPLRERRWILLMVGLYRCGRKAEALRAYQRAREALAELGLEPGAELGSLERSIAASDPALNLRDDGVSTGTHRWQANTFVLTDIVDSVALWEADSDHMAEAMARHDALVVREVTAAGGTLVHAKGEGDSTFSVFARPLDAVVAAAAIQRAVADEPWALARPLEVRAGVHTGEAETREANWYGPAVNRAARLRGLAAGGQTLVSGVCAGLVADKLPPALRLAYRGRRTLRGIERPEEVWELGPADNPRVASTMRPTGATALPDLMTRLVGRTAELARLAELIGEYRLVTIAGPGGIGKTRLAVELAHRLAGEGIAVWYAELAPLRDPGPLVDVIAETVGVEPGPDRLATLQRRAEQLDGVLVLDNCEHLLDACTTLVSRLLQAGLQLRVLTTSREPLGLAGERIWPVAPLGVPNDLVSDRLQLAATQATDLESVELLLDRGRALRPDLELSDEVVPAVVRICRALDGMPLAIELAASRLHAFGFQDLADRLDDQLSLLARRASAGHNDERHHTLRLAVGWSYDLLTPRQQRLAQGLSVFAGGFRLDAVDDVLGGDGDVLDGIDDLVAKSLVHFDHITARYRLLEPVRQYLAERLDAGQMDDLKAAHARCTAGLSIRLGRGLMTDQQSCSNRLAEERNNIELALRWTYDHDLDLAARVVGSVWPYWFLYDQTTGRRWCEAVVTASADLPPRLRARALLAAGIIVQNDGAWDRSIRRLRDALEIFRAERAVAGQASALFWLGRTFVHGTSPSVAETVREAKACLEEALALTRQSGDDALAGWCAAWLANHALWSGDLDRAEALATDVIEMCYQTGARAPLGTVWSVLAYTAWRRGDDEVALAYLHDGVGLYRDLGEPHQLAWALLDLAAYKAAWGLPDETMQHLAEAARLGEQAGSQTERARSLAIAAYAYLVRGDRDMATAALGAFDATGYAWRWEGHWATAQIIDGIPETRAALDPRAVAAAAEDARHRSVDALIDDLIMRACPGKERHTPE
jgi:predicted ATPase/class 3 adenylate cyclase